MKYHRNSKLQIWAFWILFALTMTIHAFVDTKGLDWKLIFTLLLSTFFYFLTRKRVDRSEMLLAFISICIPFFALLFYPNDFKASSYLFTLAYFFTFLLYKNLCLQGQVSLDGFYKFIKYSLVAFFVVLVIQQIQWILGMAPINDRYPEGIKRCSLAMEPSNMLIIAPAIMFVFIKIQELRYDEREYALSNIWKRDRWYWLAFLYTCLSCGSMSAVFTLPILFCYFLKRKVLLYLPLALIAFLIAALYVKNTNPEVYDRVINLGQITSIDSRAIALIDPSASTRFVPYIEFFKSLDLFDLSTWFGHGMSSLDTLCKEIIINGDDTNIGTANIFSLFYDHGMIIGLLFFAFLIPILAPRFFSYEVFFYFSVISVAGINRSMLWMFICFMFTLKYLQKYENNKSNCIKSLRKRA